MASTLLQLSQTFVILKPPVTHIFHHGLLVELVVVELALVRCFRTLVSKMSELSNVWVVDLRPAAGF